MYVVLYSIYHHRAVLKAGRDHHTVGKTSTTGDVQTAVDQTAAGWTTCLETSTIGDAHTADCEYTTAADEPINISSDC